MAKPKPKRTSSILKFCSKHGKFVGFQWGGHRRVCQAKEVDEAGYLATMKPVGKAAAALPKPVTAAALLKRVTEKVEKPLQKGRHTVVSNAGSTAEKVITDVKNHLFDLDTEISRLTKECEEAQQTHTKKQQLLADARGEKDEIVRGLKQMI